MKRKASILNIFFILFFIGFSSHAQEVRLDNCDDGIIRQEITGGRQCSANNNWTVAVDVIVPADKDLTLRTITPSFGMMPGVTVTSVKVSIYDNGNDVPGTLLTTQNIVPSSQDFHGNQFGMDFYNVSLELDPVLLTGSASQMKYWVAFQITTSNGSDGYIETTTEMIIGNALAFSSGGGFIIPDPTKEGVYSYEANCEDISGGSFPFPYCGPVNFATVEPITYVEFAGISHRSSATVNGTPAHEDFTDILGEVRQGEAYTIYLEGNTVGDFADAFVVFIDWNQNGILDDEGEVYMIDDLLINSTGEDGLQVSAQIEVPVQALEGTTRIRIKKTYETPVLNPCVSGSGWGQAEDYSITVLESLNTPTVEAPNIEVYPNPVTDILNIQNNNPSAIISVYTIAGRKIFSAQGVKMVDFTAYATGLYIVQITDKEQTQSFKLIKN